MVMVGLRVMPSDVCLGVTDVDGIGNCDLGSFGMRDTGRKEMQNGILVVCILYQLFILMGSLQAVDHNILLETHFSQNGSTIQGLSGLTLYAMADLRINVFHSGVNSLGKPCKAGRRSCT